MTGVATSTPRRTLLPIVALSLSITTAAGLLALGVHTTLERPFLVTFVILRWAAVALLLATPLLRYRRPSIMLPAPLRTPLTALLLTIESVLVDIASAHL